MSTDMSDRNFLLSTLDEQRVSTRLTVDERNTIHNRSLKNSGKLSWVLDSSNNVSLSLSAYNVKISKDRAGVSTRRSKRLDPPFLPPYSLCCTVSLFTRWPA